LEVWVFEIEETTGQQIASRLMVVYNDYPAAQRKLETAMDRVRSIYRETMLDVRNAVINS